MKATRDYVYHYACLMLVYCFKHLASFCDDVSKRFREIQLEGTF